MNSQQKTHHLICTYGAEEPYLNKDSRNAEDNPSVGKGEHISVMLASERAQLFDPGYSCYDQDYSNMPYNANSIYDDCLNMLNGTLGYGGCSQGSGSTCDSQEEGRPAISKGHAFISCNESMFSCIHSEAECLDLIEGTRRGAITRVRRRLNEKEKSMIRPGSIFVYKEQESGIRRWTDKKEWTPSRVLGTFLAYRDLNGQLYKKTFSKQISDERYHVVIYSSYEWEKNGKCCVVFGKSKGHGFQAQDADHRQKRYLEFADVLSSNSLLEGSTGIFKFDISPRSIADRDHLLKGPGNQLHF